MKTPFFNIRKLTTATLLSYCVFSQAKPLITPLDQVTWQQHGSRFTCQLSTAVTNFGRVSLTKNAGYNMTLELDSVLYTQPLKQQQLGASAPPWSKQQLPKANWFTSVKDQHANLLLQQLQQGNWGHVQLDFADGENIHLVLPTVQRGEHFEQYFHCLNQLAPLSYDQVRDRNFYFPANELLLNKSQQKQLADIVRFVELEPNVSRILIDGHADISGHSSDNLRLSQQRADDLYAHLLEAGIDKSLIEVRSHGDRYPVNSNRDAKQRANNRRVNLRIILKESVSS